MSAKKPKYKNMESNNSNHKYPNNLNTNKNIINDNYSEFYKNFENIKEINDKNDKGYTPIYLSILSNNIKLLKELLTQGADPNIPNNLEETPLYLSVNTNNFEAFLILLKNNANCNIPNIKGSTPLHIAVQKRKKNIYKHY